MRGNVALLAVLCACGLYFPEPGTHSDIARDAGASEPANDPACGDAVDCGDGRHCAIECSQYGAIGCPYNCHMTCEPDTACSAVDTCMPPSICVNNCYDTCQAMAAICMLGCTAPDDSCQQITNEADCAARSDCMPLYLASGCTCDSQLDTCTCANEKVSFARCDSTTDNE